MKIDAIVMRDYRYASGAFRLRRAFGVTLARRILLVRGSKAWGWNLPHVDIVLPVRHPYSSPDYMTILPAMHPNGVGPRLIGVDIAKGTDVPALVEQVADHVWLKLHLMMPYCIWSRSLRISLSQSFLGGTPWRSGPCCVLIAFSLQLEQTERKGGDRLAAGYQRIKLKCKPVLGREGLREGRNDGRAYCPELRCQRCISIA